MPAPMFFTINQKVWQFSDPKTTGSHGVGTYGGFYRCGQIKGLIKQDPVISLNIAEFLAGKIYQAIVPDVSARIELVRVDPGLQRSDDGSNVYVLSEFIPGWTHDLYTEIQTHFKRSADHSTVKLLETSALHSQLIWHKEEIASFFTEGQKQGHYLNFGQVAATSLLVNNMDINLGNLGVTSVGELAIVDYGAAFRQMDPTINPHAFKKYLFSHTINREGWNNFLFYPESIKITPEFVSELDKASQADLEQVIHNAFDEIAQYYGIKPIIDFAVRAGLALRLTKSALNQLQENDHLAQDKLLQLKKLFVKNMQSRQGDLSRFSAQIKIDMCIGKEACLFKNHQGKTVDFNEVVFQHLDYFVDILKGKEQFKFRKSAHKYLPELLDEVKTKSMHVLAGFLLLEHNQGIREEHYIEDMFDAMVALKNKTLHPNELANAFPSDFRGQVEGIVSTHEKSTDKELHAAIADLKWRCFELGRTYNQRQKNALDTYKKKTIELALNGKQAFKEGYSLIRDQAIEAIDDNQFANYARLIGNILLIVCATVSVVGLFALVYARSETRGLLFFQGPLHQLDAATSELERSLDARLAG